MECTCIKDQEKKIMMAALKSSYSSTAHLAGDPAVSQEDMATLDRTILTPIENVLAAVRDLPICKKGE